MQPTLDTLLGHEDAIARLRRTVEAGRLASTYLFVGPEGIGKRSFARALACSLLCNGSGDRSLTACGDCASCTMLAGGSHPDLLEVGKPEGKSTLPLELFIGPPDKRHKEGLCHDLALRPMVASRRVAIIDDADALSIESANALLKTLEEPPPRSLLVLLGTSLARQLPTIRSRCQVIRFSPLTAEQVVTVLGRLSLEVEPGEAQRVSQQSGGSVSEALAALAEEASEYERAMADCLAAADFVPGRFTAIIDEAVKFGGSEPAQKRRRLRQLVRVGVDHWRERLVGPDSVVALDSLEALLDAEAAIDRNANQAAVTTALAGRLWQASRG